MSKEEKTLKHALEDGRSIDLALSEFVLEALVPAHERLVVVRAQVVDVLHDELLLGEFHHLLQRRQEAVGEDVPRDPQGRKLLAGLFCVKHKQNKDRL